MKHSRFYILCVLLAAVTGGHWLATFGSSDAEVEKQKYRVVHVTKHGQKMHELGCPQIRDSRFVLPYDRALIEGYTPCQTCMPE